MSLRTGTLRYTESCSDKDESIKKLKEALYNCDAIIIGAGSGLSTSAGFTYSGERFEKTFPDFIKKYGFSDMYTAGFYRFEKLEEYWAYWSRQIYINRYQDPPKPVYKRLLELVKDKDHFVITTNVDHCFQKAGFDKERLFYTQGDYGLLRCSVPCHDSTYDNEEIVFKMLDAQGIRRSENGELELPSGDALKTVVPSELVPRCPKCGKPMSTNLRVDGSFVEDKYWHKAMERYEAFIEAHKNSGILFFELGVGGNTPGIIKYPFWRMTKMMPSARYVSVNLNESYLPSDISDRGTCIKGDIGEIIELIA